MIESHTRDLSEYERSTIEKGLADARADTSPFRLAGSLVIALAVTVGCGYSAVLILRTLSPFVAPLLAMPLGFGSFLGFFSAIRSIENHSQTAGFARQVVSGCQEALEDGHVAVKRFVATRVIEIEAPEDGMPGYLFDVGNGRILVLTGPHSNDVDADVPWPNSDFELTRTVGGNLWLGIHCRGAELLPTRIVQSKDCGVEFVSDEREDVISADLEEYADSLVVTD